jgi:hypothetical protein
MDNTAIDPKVIDRIRKTLNLSRNGGATEHEAAAAADMAQKLMRKYNLTMAEVEAAGGVGEAGSKRTKQTQKGRAQYEFQQQLMLACAEVNFCVVLTRKEYARGHARATGYSLIGREANVIATQNLFDYLAATTERLAFEFVGSDNRRRLSREAVSFKVGCAVRLVERLRARHTQAMAAQAADAKAANAHPTNGMALAIVLTDFAQDEADRNEDFLSGVPEGTHKARRQQQELNQQLQLAVHNAISQVTLDEPDAMLSTAYNAACLRAGDLGLDLSAQDTQSLVQRAVRVEVRFRQAELAEAAWRAQETPAQRAKREIQEDKANRRFWEHQERQDNARADRLDPHAYRAGARAGSTVGLDTQVAAKPASKPLPGDR